MANVSSLRWILKQQQVDLQVLGHLLLDNDLLGKRFITALLHLDRYDPHPEPLTLDSIWDPLALEILDARPGVWPMEKVIDELQALADELTPPFGDTPFLRRNLVLKGFCEASIARAHVLAGTGQLNLAEQSLLMFGLAPGWTDEAMFTDVLAHIEELIPERFKGEGTLPEQFNAWLNEFRILRLVYDLPLTELIVNRVLDQLLARAEVIWPQLKPFPPRDRCVIEIDAEKPFGADNKYWGMGWNLLRMVFRAKLPPQLVGIIGLLAHELVPGHWWDGWFKERMAWKNGWREWNARATFTQLLTLAEGAAMCAADILWPDMESRVAFIAELYQMVELKIDPQEIAGMHEVLLLVNRLRPLRANAALMLVAGEPQETINAYLVERAFVPPQDLDKFYGFIEANGPYTFVYDLGHKFYLNWLQRHIGIEAQQAAFARLLCEPMVPAVIKQEEIEAVMSRARASGDGC